MWVTKEAEDKIYAVKELLTGEMSVNLRNWFQGDTKWVLCTQMSVPDGKCNRKKELQ